MQTNWHWLHVVVSVLSVGSWVGVAYVVTNTILVDFDFYFVWIHSLNGGSFWLALLVICTMIWVKDVALAYVQRFGFYTNVHIMQEVSSVSIHGDFI